MTQRQVSHASSGADSGRWSMEDYDNPELIVQRSFTFLKENIQFEEIVDELYQDDVITRNEKDGELHHERGIHICCETLIKLLIRKKKCATFINTLKKVNSHNFIVKKLNERAMEDLTPARDFTPTHGFSPCFSMSCETLRKNVCSMYMELEPREIADYMFQNGHFSVDEHDMVSKPNRKLKRITQFISVFQNNEQVKISNLIKTLKEKKYTNLLHILEKGAPLVKQPAKIVSSVKQNFRNVLETLLKPDLVVEQLRSCFTQTDVRDINYCKGDVAKHCKIVKIVIMRGKEACEELHNMLGRERGDIISVMENRCKDLQKRGKPVLKTIGLQKICISTNKESLQSELDVEDICNILLEEEAVTIPDHDRVVESKHRTEQFPHLFKLIDNNVKDCFHYFIFALESLEYNELLQELAQTSASSQTEPKEYEVDVELLSLRRFDGADTLRKDCDLSMTMEVEGVFKSVVEDGLQQKFGSDQDSMEELVTMFSQMSIRDMTGGSIVIRLHPITDDAIRNLLDAEKNNKLIDMIVSMIKTAGLAEVLQGSDPIRIKIQISKTESDTSRTKHEIGRTEQIKRRITAQRDFLFSEMEPRSLIPVLSKEKYFSARNLEATVDGTSCTKRVEQLLSLILQSEADGVEQFLNVLRKLGQTEITERLDPGDIHGRAENIRKLITANYKNIIDEMQMSLARETLSRCCGNVDAVKDKILPRNGNRKKRMNNFLQFILEDDDNVLEFERTLRRNGLDELLQMDSSLLESSSSLDSYIEIPPSTLHESSGILLESEIKISFPKVNHKAGVKPNQRETFEPKPGPSRLSKEEERLKAEIEREEMTRKLEHIRIKEDSLEETYRLEKIRIEEKMLLKIKDVTESSELGIHPSASEIETQTEYAESGVKIPQSMSFDSILCTSKPSRKSIEKKVQLERESLYDTAGPSVSPEYVYKRDISPITPLVVAAIDFGTTYSGFAFSFKNKPERITTIKSSSTLSDKEPTALLLDERKEVIAFGNEAVERYKEMCEDDMHHTVYYFNTFKMTLHQEKTLSRNTKIFDENKKPHMAMDVFSKSIEEFRRRLIATLDSKRSSVGQDEIRWIITVPAIWGENAKQFMRESAIQAGIPVSCLMLALEPEVASIYVKTVQLEREGDGLCRYKPGKRFLVMDLGGGTADLTAMSVKEDGSLEQLCRASGGDWGGNGVNSNFIDVMEKLFGEKVMEDFRIQHKADFIDLLHDFEVKKRAFRHGRGQPDMQIQICVNLRRTAEKMHGKDLPTVLEMSEFSQLITLKRSQWLQLSATFVTKYLFNPVVNKIVNESRQIVEELKGSLEDIMMVGGFSESQYVYESVKDYFPDLRIIRATECGLAVLKGAVLYGHDTGVISSRVCSYTYGFGLYRLFMRGDPNHLKVKMGGKDHIMVFKKLVTIGQKVKVGEIFSVPDDITSVLPEVTQLAFKVYRAMHPNPRYVDDSCIYVGKLTVNDVTDSVNVALSFGLTEMTVMAKFKSTGRRVETKLDLLE